MLQCFQKKHWHEFGEALQELVYRRPDFDSFELFRTVANELTVSLDPLVIIEILDVQLTRYQQYSGTCLLEILEAMKALYSKNELATHYLKVISAKQLLLSEQLQAGIDLLKEAEPYIEAKRSLPKIIYVTLYLTKSIYDWRIADFAAYSQSIERFEAYVDQWKLTSREKEEISERAITASLLTDTILTFGHIEASGIFSFVKSMPSKLILYELIRMFNEGRASDFDDICQQRLLELQTFPLIYQSLSKLKMKIRVIALYN